LADVAAPTVRRLRERRRHRRKRKRRKKAKKNRERNSSALPDCQVVREYGRNNGKDGELYVMRNHRKVSL
jgi:hypothetical protein